MSRLTDQLLERAARAGVRGPTARGEYCVQCPLCRGVVGKPDTKWKMQLNPVLGVYHCFRCGAGGKAQLGWLVHGSLPQPVEVTPDALGPPEGYVALHGNHDSEVLRPYLDYLLPRLPITIYPAAGGVESRAQLLRRLQFGACPTGRYAGRVILPDLNLQGNWRGFAARAISRAVEPRYLYPAGMRRAEQLYGEYWPDGSSTDRDCEVWVVEGPFDALALYPHGVACYGKNVTDHQMETLVRWGEDRRLIVCLDGDAWEEARILAMQLILRGAEHVQWCRLPPGKDPGSLGWDVRNYLQAA